MRDCYGCYEVLSIKKEPKTRAERLPHVEDSVYSMLRADARIAELQAADPTRHYFVRPRARRAKLRKGELPKAGYTCVYPRD
jgi:hypothetical protein